MNDKELESIYEDDKENVIATFSFSIIFHIIVLVIVPLLITLLKKPTVFERPQTFEIISMPQVKKVVQEPKKKVVQKEVEMPKPKKVEQPKKQEIKKKVVSNKPKKVEKPKPKKVETKPDVSDIDDLFADTPTPPKVSTIKTVSTFKYNWYLSNLRSKIESHWQPTIKDSTISVELAFDITKNGALSNIRITKSSGKPILDRQAQRAIELSFPMPPLPKGFSGSSLSLIYTLVPYRN